MHTSGMYPNMDILKGYKARAAHDVECSNTSIFFSQVVETASSHFDIPDQPLA
jgi:hypothetical protein